MKRKILVLLNTLTLAAVIIVNALSASGGINNHTVGEISRKYETLFAPANYAFSIWGIIYLLLIGFIVFQWYSLIKNKYSDVIDDTGFYFILTNFANMLWLFLWLHEFIGLSVIVMFLLLAGLIIIMFRLKLEIWDAQVRIIFFVWWPFSFYLGWIISASIANTAAFLTTLNWNGSPFSPQIWTIIMIIIAGGVYTFLVLKRNLRESAVVGIWALAAIAAKQASQNIEITFTALLIALVLLILISYHGIKNRDTAPVLKLRRGEF